MYSFKVSSHVSFPLEGLDLRPFLAKECTSQVTTYDLLSVICHHGTAGSEYASHPNQALLHCLFPVVSITWHLSTRWALHCLLSECDQRAVV